MTPVWVLFAVLVFQSASVWGATDDSPTPAQLTKMLAAYKRQAKTVTDEIQELLDDDMDISNISKISKNLQKIDDLQDNINSLTSTLNKIKLFADYAPKLTRDLINQGLGIVGS